MTLRVSFVIPVYNVEKYLCRCIDSIYAQGLKEDEYEIILVNDGSTDNSYNICCHYATNNSNIVLINQDNQGNNIVADENENNLANERNNQVANPPAPANQDNQLNEEYDNIINQLILFSIIKNLIIA